MTYPTNSSTSDGASLSEINLLENRRGQGVALVSSSFSYDVIAIVFFYSTNESPILKSGKLGWGMQKHGKLRIIRMASSHRLFLSIRVLKA